MGYLDRKLINEVRSGYPLPIPKLLAKRIGRCVDPPRKDWHLAVQLTFAAFEKTWILASCIVASEYLRLRPFFDDEIRAATDARIRPVYEESQKSLTMGQWWGLFRDVTAALGSQRENMVMPEMYSFHFKNGGACTKISNVLGNQVIKWRNKFVHEHDVPAGEAAKADALFGLEHLQKMLESMSFLSNYSIIQTDNVLGSEPNGEKYTTGFNVLRGLHVDYASFETAEQFAVKKLYLAPVAGLEGNELTVNDTLCLDPLLVFEYCKHCEKEEFFYYMLHDGQQECLHYKSPSSRCHLYMGKEEDPYRRLMEVLTQTLTAPPPQPGEGEARAPQVTKEKLLKNSQSRLSAVLSAKKSTYIPELYVKRELDESIEDFLRRPSTVAGIVTGRSGVGKTCLLCNNLTARTETDIICYIDCDTLTHADIVELDGRIVREIGEQCSFDELLEQIYPQEASLEELEDSPQIVIVFDSINTYSGSTNGPQELYKSILSLVQSINSKVKVLATCTTETWNEIKTLQPLAAYYFLLKDGEPLRLESFKAQEARDAYRKYSKKYDLRTTWENTTADVRDHLVEPIFLKILAEIYEGRQIPPSISGLKLFKEYKAEINKGFNDGEFDETVTHLLRRVDESGQTSVVVDDGLSAVMGTGFSKMSALGIIVEQGPVENAVGFRYERFLEFLMADYYMRDVGDLSQKIIALVNRSASFPTLRGTVIHMVVRGMVEDRRLVANIVEEEPSARVAGLLVDALSTLSAESPELFSDCLCGMVQSKRRTVRQVVSQTVGAYMARATDEEAAIEQGLEVYRFLAVDGAARVRDACVHAYSEALRGNFNVGIAIFAGMTENVLQAIRDIKSIRIIGLINPRKMARLEALVETYSGMTLVTIGEHIEKADKQEVILKTLAPLVPELEFIFHGLMGMIRKFIVRRIERGYRENVRYPTTYREIKSNLESEDGRGKIIEVCVLLASDDTLLDESDDGLRIAKTVLGLLDSDEELVSYLVGILLAQRLSKETDDKKLENLIKALMFAYQEGSTVCRYNICAGLAHANFASEERTPMLLEAFATLGEHFTLETHGMIHFKDKEFFYDADMVSMLARAHMLAGVNQIDFLGTIFKDAEEDEDPVYYDYAISTLGELGTTYPSPGVLLTNLRQEIDRLLAGGKTDEADKIRSLLTDRRARERRLNEQSKQLLARGEPPMTTEWRRRVVVTELWEEHQEHGAGPLKDLLQKLGMVQLLVHLKSRFPQEITVFVESFKAGSDCFLQVVTQEESAAPSEYVFYSDQTYHKIFNNFEGVRVTVAKAVQDNLEQKKFRDLFGGTLGVLGPWLAEQVEEQSD